MVSTHKKRQSSRRLLGQLDDFHQDMIIGNTSCERQENVVDNKSVTSVNSERGERVEINASFENASENNDILRVSKVNDETRQNISDEVSELSVPETHFDRQTHTHHRWWFRNARKRYGTQLIITGKFFSITKRSLSVDFILESQFLGQQTNFATGRKSSGLNLTLDQSRKSGRKQRNRNFSTDHEIFC